MVALGVVLSRGVAGVLRALLAEAGKLTQAVEQGRLDVRGDLTAVGLEIEGREERGLPAQVHAPDAPAGDQGAIMIPGLHH